MLTKLGQAALFRSTKIQEKSKLDKPRPGTHKVNVVLRIRGEIKVGRPYPQAVTAGVPWQKLCGVLLGKLNTATAQKVTAEALLSHVREAHLGEESEEIKKVAQECMGRIVRSSTKQVSGKVTGSLVVDEVTPYVVISEPAKERVGV